MASTPSSPALAWLRPPKSLKWTSVRADIVRCTDAQAHRWEIAENLFRAHLTPLEEAKYIDEWIRLVADPESVSRQDVVKSKGGRPEGAITKAARTLPIKGKTEGARRKRIERVLKIASMSPESEAAAKKAGLDNDHSALDEIAKEKTAEDQLAKLQEIAKHMAAPKASQQHAGFGRKKTKTKATVVAVVFVCRRRKSESKVYSKCGTTHAILCGRSPNRHRRFAKNSSKELRQSVADNDNEQEDSSKTRRKPSWKTIRSKSRKTSKKTTKTTRRRAIRTTKTKFDHVRGFAAP